MDKDFLSTFRNPGSEYRGAPFWAWNGDLAPDELRRQIRVMHDMGLGGFFMHSRVGLATDYMSERWMECIGACIDEAEKLTMRAWLYDEDRWPSGAAGGLVTKDPAYRQRALVLDATRDARNFEWEEGTLAACVARLDGTRADTVRPLKRGDAAPECAEGEVVLRFTVRVDDSSSWFNGQTYLDTLNAEAVQEFIRQTHAVYADRFGEHFGKVVPGIFTDEPQHQSKTMLSAGDDGLPSGSVPWTDRLPNVFRERYGYDLLDRVVELFFDVSDGGISQARYHFHDCVAHLFVNAFARQIGEWCDAHDMEHTGHLMEEPALVRQANKVTNCMRFYEYMQAPGMDLLSQYRREYDTAKQVSSAARQFGRRWRLTETYGVTGWDFDWTGHKALGDWQAALGINLRCQHLSWYTMQGQAKRDYPASMLHQSPWWPHYRKVEDYFARVNSVITRGREVRDLLVVHPIESTWTQIRVDWMQDPDVRGLEKELFRLRDVLLRENLDFDYGDEDILARHGEVAVDHNNNGVLRVGEAEYRAVVLPKMVTVRQSTLDLLREFRKAGGTVVFAAPPAEAVDAAASRAAAEFAQACILADSAEDAAAALSPAARRVSMTDDDGRELGGLLHLLCEDEQAQYLFICNTSEEPGQPGLNDIPVAQRTVTYPQALVEAFQGCAGAPVELDLETGSTAAASACRDRDKWLVRTSFDRLQSRVFAAPKTTAAAFQVAPPEETAAAIVSQTEVNPEQWDIGLSEPNVLVLDRPAYRLEDGQWQAPDEVLRIDNAVRDALGVPRRGGRMKQPWAQDPVPAPRTVAVDLRFAIQVETVPNAPLWLALEHPTAYDASLNGVELDLTPDDGWWVDPSLRRVPVDPALFQEGENSLDLRIEYPETFVGLESFFLLGSFGVRVNGTEASLVEAPAALQTGDWCDQGLPFYSGNVAYRERIEPRLGTGQRMFVRIPQYRGVAVRVLVDGDQAGIAAWPPFEVDVTAWVAQKSSVTLTLEVLGHRRNSHGPLHLTDPSPRWLGSAQFVTDGDLWTDEYRLVPCGLTAPPVLLVRE